MARINWSSQSVFWPAIEALRQASGVCPTKGGNGICMISPHPDPVLWNYPSEPLVALGCSHVGSAFGACHFYCYHFYY